MSLLLDQIPIFILQQNNYYSLSHVFWCKLILKLKGCLYNFLDYFYLPWGGTSFCQPIIHILANICI